MTLTPEEQIGALLPLLMIKEDIGHWRISMHPAPVGVMRSTYNQIAVRAILEACKPMADGTLWYSYGTSERLAGADFYRSYYWPAVRLAVLMRDGYRCTMCGKAEEHMEVHHILPRCAGGADNPRNLRTLCTKCHDIVHHDLDISHSIDKGSQKLLDEGEHDEKEEE